MKRYVVPVAVLVAVALALWRYPPIRVVSLADANAAAVAQAFDAEAFAGKLWDDQLPAAFAQAADAGKVVAAIRADAKVAKEEFGRSVGLSRGYFYFLAGVGEIVSVETNKVGVALEAGSSEADFVLVAGPVFGNAVRDATGLVNASDFINSQDFNGIAQELNRRVEAQVIPELVAEAKAGRRVRFVGCVEVRNEPGDLRPLKVVPVSVQFE